MAVRLAAPLRSHASNPYGANGFCNRRTSTVRGSRGEISAVIPGSRRLAGRVAGPQRRDQVGAVSTCRKISTIARSKLDSSDTSLLRRRCGLDDFQNWLIRTRMKSSATLIVVKNENAGHRSLPDSVVPQPRTKTNCRIPPCRRHIRPCPVTRWLPWMIVFPCPAGLPRVDFPLRPRLAVALVAGDSDAGPPPVAELSVCTALVCSSAFAASLPDRQCRRVRTRNIFLFLDIPGDPPDRTACLAVGRVLSVLFRMRRARLQACRLLRPGDSCELSFPRCPSTTCQLLFSCFRSLRCPARGGSAGSRADNCSRVAAVVHALTFVQAVLARRTARAGSQTTVWLYMVWHGGFPLLVSAFFFFLWIADGKDSGSQKKSGL